MSVTTTLSERMKEYERVSQLHLIRKQPVIIRLDGKAFRTFTKKLQKPYDMDLSNAFEFVCENIIKYIDNVKFVYTQSDEISLLLLDTQKVSTDCWFDNKLQKIVSVSASYATLLFNEYVYNIVEKYKQENNIDKLDIWTKKLNCAVFDSRAFNLPVQEVCNYFIYRQRDAIRNSKQSLAQAYFSQKQLNGKNTEQMCTMVKEQYGIDYNKLSLRQQRGFCYKSYINDAIGKTEWILDTQIPLFNEDRNYIESYLLKGLNI